MTLSDVVPVAVPLDPGGTESVTVPANTHVLYYCHLAPVVPAADLSNQKHDSWRLDIFSRLLEATSAKLAVNGEQIGVVKEVIRPNGVTDLGFWNLTDPLPVGTHKVTLHLAVNPEPSASTLSCMAYPSKLTIQWTDKNTVTVETVCSVIETSAEEFHSTRDPFWDRKTVYTARH